MRTSWHWLYSKGTLHQFYICIRALIVEHNEIHHIKEVQDRLRHVNYVEFRRIVRERILAQGARPGAMYIAPTTFRGSNRHMEKGFRQLNAYIQHFGEPSLFLTVTSNPRWEQIQECLNYPENTYDDASDLLMRVWIDVKDRILDDVMSRGIFGKCVAIFYSIEYQKRGGAHFHAIIWLEEKLTPELVDDYITAEFVELPDDGDRSPEAAQRREIRTLQQQMQIHRCDQRCLKQRRGVTYCEAHFPYAYNYRTELGRGEYAKLMRRPPPPSGVEIPPQQRCLYSPETVLNSISLCGKLLTQF